MSEAFRRPVGVAHLTADSEKTVSSNAGETAVQKNAASCIQCGAALTRDDIGLTKKLVNRGAVTFFCKACLARKFNMTVEDCDTLIAHFREAGCHFFQ